MSFMPMDGGPKAPGIGVEASVKVPEVKVSGVPGGDLAHVAGGSLGGATPEIIGSAGPNLRLHHMAKKTVDSAARHLCQGLNATMTQFAGTDLRLIDELVSTQNP